MTRYHATMIDECGDEYGVTLDVDDSVENVTEHFRELYPESGILFIKPSRSGSTGTSPARTQRSATTN